MPIADEPCRKIVYDIDVPSVFNAYAHSMVVNSFSKDLSLADDVAFSEILKDNLILVTPGKAFGGPGYFRLSYAVPEESIKGSLLGFKNARAAA